jgi:hypothetical protein
VSRAGAILMAFVLAACGGTAVPEASQVAAEESLLFGIRRDAAVDCQPERDGLPAGALGAITCLPENSLVTRLTLIRWDTEERLLEAYFTALEDHGVQRASGDCSDEGGAESAYWPGEDDTGTGVPARQACFRIGNESVALATIPPTVLAEVHGNVEQPDEVLQWLWAGNQDVPGSPTIWNADGPINIEKG